MANKFSKKRIWVLTTLFLFACGTERVIYGIAHAQGDTSILHVAGSFPLYLPTTFRSLATRLGLNVRQTDSTTYSNKKASKPYPITQLLPIAAEHPPNIIWLVSESLRADMLNPEFMPNTWAFAQRGVRFTHHFSGGNGTRMGIFSMFYGLYGTYWHSFLEQRRGPVLVDQLINASYAMRMQTSSHFTYPEFDKTVWANVPSSALLEDDQGEYWERDRRNVDRAIRWIGEQQAQEKPYFFFQFFESPHANYSFPTESIIKEPYLETFNYATLDVNKDMDLVKARYINSVHHLDQQLGKLLDQVAERGDLSNTIILITGDHGEEFMERGHWGHNSAYTNEQTQVPLVIVAPALQPRVVDAMTSHLDIAPTILRLLGNATPAENFALGQDLLGDISRTDTLVAGWNTSALVTDQYKLSLSMQAFDFGEALVTNNLDEPVPNPSEVYQQHSSRLAKLLQEMAIF